MEKSRYPDLDIAAAIGLPVATFEAWRARLARGRAYAATVGAATAGREVWPGFGDPPPYHSEALDLKHAALTSGRRRDCEQIAKRPYKHATAAADMANA